MHSISADQVHQHLPYHNLIEALRRGFCEGSDVPQRHHHNFLNPNAQKESTLLLMPAWQAGGYLGVKLIVVSPENVQRELPSIQGMYLLFDAVTGTPLAQIDAKALTSRRTAASSALAASYLCRSAANCLLIVGTGVLSRELAHAYAAIRPIQQVLVWGRNLQRAQQVVSELSENFPQVEAVENLEEGVKRADIISCATLSEKALVKGAWLRPGQHLDLIGSYKPDMRETDDAAMRRASIFIDTQSACLESGDLYLPLQNGAIGPDDICGDLYDLCLGKHPGRTEESELTLFKSVGYALEDLVAAKLVYEKICELGTEDLESQ
ncbi:MAG: ornithine cyclodeaminase family protein [Bacteroidota bacterium]